MKHVLTWLIGIAAVLGAAGIYWGYAPRPSPPEGPAEERNVNIGGRERRYLVYAPPSLQPAGSLLIAFPGSGESAENMRNRTSGVLERLAREQGFVVVYMNGFGHHFNDCRRVASYRARQLGIDDVSFTRAVIDQLALDREVDRSRVYALGFSNGGHMTFRLALEAPDLVAGIIAIGADFPAPDNLDCRIVDGRHPAVVLIQGTHDPISPYGGGRVSIFGFGDRGNVLGAEASAQWFAAEFGATFSDMPTLLGEQGGMVAQQRDWSGPAARVRLITILGAGHTIPQAAYRYPRILGPTFQTDEVIESAWRFVQER